MPFVGEIEHKNAVNGKFEEKIISLTVPVQR